MYVSVNSSIKQSYDFFLFGSGLFRLGISNLMNLSEILTCMIFGLVVGNHKHSEKLKDLEEAEIGFILPLFYLLFFTIAGANLHIKSLSNVGLIGLLYIVGRITGKGIGAYLVPYLLF
ncbi:MAG TPA: cation:proton antiporter [Salinivirga sp.]|uniref:cation:proton antiporter domain-containing protein n=1 Tax=Salinivirga sp. TaxID=1970192 RepID=UPI002B4A9FA5|nr:cation:proton antiporter [Salinivirga sp.]HKK58601.1 cation:proton antiporter [Salinivirga sp.]